MNFESRQVIEGYQKDGDSQVQAQAWGEAKISYLEAIREFDRISQEDSTVVITADDLALKKQIEKSLVAAEAELAKMHREWALAAFSNKDFARAVEEFEEAMQLAADDAVEFLEEIKGHYDKAKTSLREKKLYDEISPFVQRGDDFRKNGNFGEAMLEYQDALKRVAGLPEEHRFVGYIMGGLRTCRRHLIKPYLTRVYRASLLGKYHKAYSILKRAILLLDAHDFTYRAFLEQIREEVAGHLNLAKAEEEEFEAPEIWQQAVQDYEEALNLYSSYTQSDPLSPVYTDGNIFEDRFLNSRRNLAKLYKNRADKFRDLAQFEKALRNYKEALKLFPKSDKQFHETFREMKKLRGQLTLPQKES